MGSTGAARRRQEREQEPPPDPVAESVAEIGRVVAESDATRRKMERHERAMRSEVGRLGQLAADCPNAERVALAVDRASERLALVATELYYDGAHNAEAREALERCAAAVELRAASASFTEAMRAAAFEAGRQAGIVEEQARASGAPRSRPAHRKRRFQVVGGIAAGSAVAAASLAAGTIVASQDSASVHAYAASRPVVRLHAGPADSAVLVPSYRSTSRAHVPRHAKPSADAASASPAPSSSSLPSSPAPQPTVPAPTVSPVDFDGTLDLQTIAVTIGPDGTGTVVFSAVGGAASWSASAPAGLSLSKSGGTLEDGQPEEITVTAQAGLSAGAGVITLTDGAGHSETVPVTWVAVPGLPL